VLNAWKNSSCVCVVDEEEVAALAVAAAELAHPVLLEGLDELVHELLGGDVEDARLRPLRADAVRDGVDEVRLAEAGAAAQKERVVPRSAASGGADRGGVGELVRWADDEVGERVLRVQALERRRGGLGDGGAARRRSFGVDGARVVGRPRRDGAVRRSETRTQARDRTAVRHGPLEIAADAPGDLHTPPRLATEIVDERRQKVLVHPLAHELVACAERDDPIGHAVELNAGKPLLETRRRLRPREGHRFVPERFVLHLHSFQMKILGRLDSPAFRVHVPRPFSHNFSTELWKTRATIHSSARSARSGQLRNPRSPHDARTNDLNLDARDEAPQTRPHDGMRIPPAPARL
jgi:hypothetical protein